MWRRISSRGASDRRESPPAAMIERIRQLYWQNLWQRILVHFPLPKRPGKLEMDNQPDLADPKT
jgi:hypothetical protein